MRVRSVDALRFLAPVSALLVALSLATSLPDTPGVAVPFVMTSLLVAVLALVAAVARVRQPLVRAAIGRRHAGCDAHTTARQCDPSAAGHVRSRAPSVFVLSLT